MKISAVTTLFHSESFIKEFYERISTAIRKITGDYEIIFVNDGSPDNSTATVLQLQETDSAVTLIELSKNFGHHKAMMTGLKFADGDFIFMIDSDLEEDPELVSIFWKELNEAGNIDVVFGIQKKRKGSWFEKFSGKGYYRFLSFISKSKYPADTLTARLMTRSYVDALKQFEEKEADLWGLFVLNGFQQKSIAVSKKNKGKTTYSLRRKIGIGIDTITTLTHRPLYIIISLGLVITFLAIINALILLINYIRIGAINSSSLIIGSIWLIGGLILLSLGIISVYISKMFLEVKNRPLSIIRKIYRKTHEPGKRN